MTVKTMRWAARGSIAILVAAVALGLTLPLGTFLIGFLAGVFTMLELFSARILYVKEPGKA